MSSSATVSEKKKLTSSVKTKAFRLIPNNFEEAPDHKDLSNKTKVYEDKVLNNFEKLDNLGTFTTIFQYVVVIVAILVLILSKIFQGSTVSYSILKPTYQKWLELKQDLDILNLKCEVQNDTLTYDAFSAYSYESCRMRLGRGRSFEAISSRNRSRL